MAKPTANSTDSKIAEALSLRGGYGFRVNPNLAPASLHRPGLGNIFDRSDNMGKPWGVPTAKTWPPFILNYTKSCWFCKEGKPWQRKETLGSLRSVSQNVSVPGAVLPAHRKLSRNDYLWSIRPAGPPWIKDSNRCPSLAETATSGQSMVRPRRNRPSRPTAWSAWAGSGQRSRIVQPGPARSTPTGLFRRDPHRKASSQGGAA